jgi:hypothetical protein
MHDGSSTYPQSSFDSGREREINLVEYLRKLNRIDAGLISTPGGKVFAGQYLLFRFASFANGVAFDWQDT